MPLITNRINGRKLLTGVSAAALGLGLAMPGALAQDESTAYEVETVAEGFDEAWGLAFLPDSSEMLVTERGGQLKLVDRESGEVEVVSGTPEVDTRNQGGLLDVAVHPDFADEPWVYMTWAGNDEEGLTATHIGRALLDRDGLELTDLEVIFIAEPFVEADGHYGSRLAFDQDNRLYVTTGDRQSKDFGPDHYSQDTGNYLGVTLRLNDDGSIPDDNPFLDDDDVLDGIYSYGHRNSQGMAFHPETGELWQNEHGEFRGDEINLIEAGGNYGWPIATYGIDYQTRERFAPTPPEVEGTIEPVFHWPEDHPEGFPPSGLVFYEGDAFPDWQGNALMGNLAHAYLGRFTVDGHEVAEAERLLDGEGWRIRDIGVGPDNGYVYVLIDDGGAPLVRLVPADG